MDYADNLLKKILTYEAWINRRFKEEMPIDIQTELHKLFNEEPESYSYYRNQIFYLVKKIQNESLLIDEINEMMDYAEGHYPAEFKALISELSRNSILKSYDISRFNMIEMTDDLNGLSTITHRVCFLYQSFYEIDAIFLFLGSLSELTTNGSLNLKLENIKDNKGNIKKGVAIEFIKSRIKKHPILLRTFETGYNANLRNTIGHNKYIRTDTEIQSEDGKIRIGIKDFMHAIRCLQELDNAMINALSLKQMQNNLNQLSNCGVLSVVFAMDGEKPVLLMFQLWCFYNIEPEKHWLKSAHFKFTDQELETNITGRVSQKGSIQESLITWFNLLKSAGDEIEVIIRPIRPQTSTQFELIQLDCGTFEVIDDEYSKIVSYEVN